jgi:hypothetical protein
MIWTGLVDLVKWIGAAILGERVPAAAPRAQAGVVMAFFAILVFKYYGGTVQGHAGWVASACACCRMWRAVRSLWRLAISALICPSVL